MTTTTLSAICAADPPEPFIRKLMDRLGKDLSEARADEAPLPVLTVLEVNGLDDALWALDNATVGTEFLRRLLAADYAERVYPMFATQFPGDERPMNAIRTARDPSATVERLAAAYHDAFDAPGAAAGAAALATAGSVQTVARLAERVEVRFTTWGVTAIDDEKPVTWTPERAAAWEGAWRAAGAAQKARLIQYLTYGEAAAAMPWPDNTTA